MGVKGLYTILQPVARPIKLESLEEKKLAIDDIWLYHFLKTMRDKEGNALKNAHLLGFFRRICKLLYYGIRPVFVFDGGAPSLKRHTLRERQRRKVGAAENVSRTAEKLLASRMRAQAVKQAALAQSAPVDPVTGRLLEQDIPDDAVYLDEVQLMTRANKKRKFRDDYDLPPVETPKTNRMDPRFATEEELKSFIDEMKPEDFDIESEVFRAMPTEVQYEIIGDLRLKSRQTSWKRLEQMMRQAPTAYDFSQAQIKHLVQRNDLTQKLLNVTNYVSSSGKAMQVMPIRVAGERSREYVLLKNQDASGGWKLGVMDGTKQQPVDVEQTSDVTSVSSESDDDVFEEVRIPNSRLEAVNEIDVSMEEFVPPPLFSGTFNASKTRDNIPNARALTFASSKPGKAPYTLDDASAQHESVLDDFVDDNISPEDIDMRFNQMEDSRKRAASSGGFDIFEDSRLDMNPRPVEATDDRRDPLPIPSDSSTQLPKVAYLDLWKGYVPAIFVDYYPDYEDLMKDALEAADVSELYDQLRSIPKRMEKLREGDSERSDCLKWWAKFLEASIRWHEESNMRAANNMSASSHLVEDTEDNSMTNYIFSFNDLAEDDEQSASNSLAGPAFLDDSEQRRVSPPSRRLLNKPNSVRLSRQNANITHSQQRPPSAETNLMTPSDMFVRPSNAHANDAPNTLAVETEDKENITSDTSPSTPPPKSKVPYRDAEPLASITRHHVPVLARGHHAEIGETSSHPTIGRVLDFEQASSHQKPSGTAKGTDTLGSPPSMKSTGVSSSSNASSEVRTSNATDARVAQSSTLGHSFSDDHKVETKQVQIASVESISDHGTSARKISPSKVEQSSIAYPKWQKGAVTGFEASESSEAEKISTAALFPRSRSHTTSSSPTAENDAYDDTKDQIESRAPTEEPSLRADSKSSSPSRSAKEGVIDEESDALAAYLEAEQEQEQEQIEAEKDDFARFVSQLSHKNLNTVQQELDDEVKQLNKQFRKQKGQADDVTQQMAKDCQDLLRLFGIPYVVAPMEAEAQCAELHQLSLVDGIVTDDSDVYLFGASRVYKNMFNQQKYVECFLATDISRELNLDRKKMVQLAFLLGSDYTEGLPGVGAVTAMELLNEFSDGDAEVNLDGKANEEVDLTALRRFKEWWLKVQMGKDTKDDFDTPFKKRFRRFRGKIHIDDTFPSYEVVRAYMHPRVDDSDAEIQWGVPDLDGLRDYLMDSFSWSQEKVDDTLIPIIKHHNQRKFAGIQSRLDRYQFFDSSSGTGSYAPRQRPKHKSERLTKVVKAWKQKDHAEIDKGNRAVVNEVDMQKNGDPKGSIFTSAVKRPETSQGRRKRQDSGR